MNKPLSNQELMDWVRYFQISIKGIFSRNEHMPKLHSPCIINLDDLNDLGTHWTACAPGDKNTLWYFDSFGMIYPKEFEERARKDNMQVIYNTSQYQNILSVLCGYYCIYFLHQWSMKKDFYDILRPFSLTNTSDNEKFIIDYFKNI